MQSAQSRRGEEEQIEKKTRGQGVKSTQGTQRLALKLLLHGQLRIRNRWPGPALVPQRGADSTGGVRLCLPK